MYTLNLANVIGQLYLNKNKNLILYKISIRAGIKGTWDCLFVLDSFPTLTAGFSSISRMTFVLVWSDTVTMFALCLVHTFEKRLPCITGQQEKKKKREKHSIGSLVSLLVSC